MNGAVDLGRAVEWVRGLGAAVEWVHGVGRAVERISTVDINELFKPPLPGGAR